MATALDPAAQTAVAANVYLGTFVCLACIQAEDGARP
jgi:hypothetical protein